MDYGSESYLTWDIFQHQERLMQAVVPIGNSSQIEEPAGSSVELNNDEEQ